jgi:L-tyrosine isonitrile synthase
MDPKNKAIEILEILQKYRRIRTSQKNNHYSIEPFIELVVPFIQKKQPFKMLLAAFHCKSINPDSVLGDTADGAEEESIRTLERLCEELKNIYCYGCELLIVQEGHFYSDIRITPPDDVIDRYESSIREMTQLPQIRFDNLMQNYPNYDEARKALFSKYMPSKETVEELIQTDSSLKSKYVAYKAFIVNEFAALMKEYTKREIREQSKILTYQWLQRFLVFKRVCADLFKDHFRFSVLCHPSKSKKFSINLIVDASECGQPWFHVLVKRGDGKMELIKKSEAEKRGYELIYVQGKPWYYIE